MTNKDIQAPAPSADDFARGHLESEADYIARLLRAAGAKAAGLDAPSPAPNAVTADIQQSPKSEVDETGNTGWMIP